MASKEPTMVHAWALTTGFEFYRNSKGHCVYWHPAAVVMPGQPRREVEVSSTPSGPILSAVRQDFTRAFAGLVPGVAAALRDTFPGVAKRGERPLADQLDANGVIALLRGMSIVVRYGDRKVEERAFTVTKTNVGATTVLELTNPFHRAGSADRIRSAPRVALHLQSGKRPLGPAALETLRDVGIDLSHTSREEVHQGFARWAHAQRHAIGNERSVERRERRALTRSVGSIVGSPEFSR